MILSWGHLQCIQPHQLAARKYRSGKGHACSAQLNLGADHKVDLEAKIARQAYLDMQAVGVCKRVHCNCAQAKLLASADDSDRYFSSICDQDLAEVSGLNVDIVTTGGPGMR